MKVIFTALLSVISCALFAQSSLEITLYDRNTEVPLSQYPITLSNASIGFSVTKNTDSQGKVKFQGLSTSGEYTVITDENDSYHAFEKGGIILKSNQSASITVLVNAKSVVNLDEVVISGANFSQINTINAEVSAELTSKEIETLPIEGRDVTRALYRLPNVTQATGFYPEAPNVAINGANSLFTNYLIDGLDNNENFLGGLKFNIPVGFAQNITVLANNYSAEYGNTANGIFNFTTKSGSNDFSGEAFYILRPGTRELFGITFDASSPLAQRDLSGNQVRDGFQRHQFGFGFGGPIVKDQTFYYVNVEHTTDLKDNLLNSPDLGVNETVAGNNNFTYLSAKIDHKWNSRFKSSLRVNTGLVNIERQGGGLEGGVSFPSTGNQQDRNSLLIAFRNVYSNSNFLSETNVQFARFRWDYANPDNPSSPNVTVLNPGDQTVAVLGHPGFIFNSLEQTYQLQQKFIYFKKNHTLKAGFDVISSDHTLLGGGNPNGSYTVRLTQAELDNLRAQNLGSNLSINDIPSDVEVLNYGIELRPASFGARHNIYSAYIEDLWSVNDKLNLTLGLRYEYDNLSEGGSDQGDFNNLAPRINLNYKLDDKSSIRAGYGLFYEKILYAVYSDALQQSTTSPDYLAQLQELIDLGILPSDTDIDKITFNGNQGASFDQTAIQAQGITYLNGPGSETLQGERNRVFRGESRILNPNGYNNPFSHQFTLGYQNQLSDDILFYVDVTHSRSFNLFRLRNLNSVSSYPIAQSADFTSADVRGPAAADSTRAILISTDAQGAFALVDGNRLRAASRNITVSETAGQARYWSATFNLVKDRGDDNYAYRLSYTLSRLRNNTDDINFRASNGNDFEAEWGPSINDRTHVLSALGYFYPTKNLSINAASLIQSGQPINRIPDGFGTTDLNGDGASFADAYTGNSDRFPGETRNNDRLPWSVNFDLGIQYQISLGGDNRLELRGDVFNVFNTENLSGYSNNATQSNQIQPGSVASGVLIRRNAGPPRQFQFGVRYLF